MNEPQTEAGKALTERLRKYYPPDEYGSWPEWVTAIEGEAAAQERERLRLRWNEMDIEPGNVYAAVRDLLLSDPEAQP